VIHSLVSVRAEATTNPFMSLRLHDAQSVAAVGPFQASRLRRELRCVSPGMYAGRVVAEWWPSSKEPAR
jgi:hypothetical protein